MQPTLGCPVLWTARNYTTAKKKYGSCRRKDMVAALRVIRTETLPWEKSYSVFDKLVR